MSTLNRKRPWCRTLPGRVSALLIGLAGCASLSTATEIPGTENDHIPLGTAYHSDKAGFYGFQSVNGQIDETYGNTEAEIQFSLDAGYKQLLNMVNGSVDASVKLTAVSVDAGGQYASQNAADEYTGTYTVYINLKPKKRLLVPANEYGYQATAAAVELANLYPGNKPEELGDEFVTGIEYGSYLIVNMKVEYRSAEDKRRIGGYLSVDVNGIVSVDGDLSLMDEDIKRSVKISISAKQEGGNPLELAKIIPDGLMQCSLNNPEPCFNLFSETVTYLKTDYINQFPTLDKYNPVKLYTQRYQTSGPGLAVLTPVSGYEDIGYLTKLTMNRLSDAWVSSMLDKRRAENIVNYYGSALSTTQKQQIEAIVDKARANAYLYADTVAYCNRNPYGPYCRDRETELTDGGYIQTYDADLLDLSAL
ncbi:hypothetical protein [Reinekea blandensis]|uniref:Lipoprotein n=1 Tax=Reinekea blandensis MED297 TaxID=314283 RepID=A4BAV2_9GAMM|nr:hypothetical protein [Reinekea blandensis]EAR10565.1 hypothetical protein MED297_11135 [Reinekea sp. MED297] [Reinekea blandensis MED297]